MADLLAVVALSKRNLVSINLHIDRNVADSKEKEISWGFTVLGRVTRNRSDLFLRFLVLDLWSPLPVLSCLAVAMSYLSSYVPL
jgi:hypothetical protein